MIGSVSEAQKQLADLEKRRQQIAARNAQSQSPPATAGAVAAPLAGWPVTGYTSAQVAKGTEPDIAKRRRKGKGGDRNGRDQVAASTAAEGEGWRAAQADDAESAKAYQDRGITEGPGTFAELGEWVAMPDEPGSYGRAYLEAGHGARSPMAEQPRENPMPDMQHYLPPGSPQVAAVPPGAIDRYTLRSPSE